MILIVLVYFLTAWTFPLGKLILQYIDPIFFIGVRMTFAGLLLLGARKFIQKKPLSFDWNDKKLFALIILCHIYIAYIFEFIALDKMNSVKVSIFYNLMPFITEILLYFSIKGRTISSKKILGLSIGFIGMIWLLYGTSGEEVVLMWSDFAISWPEILLLVSIVSCSYGWIVVQKLVHKGYSSLHINGIGMLFGGIAALITTFIFEGMPILKNPEIIPFQSLFLMLQSSIGLTNAHIAYLTMYCLVMILIANFIGYNLYAYLLHFYSATFLAFAGFIAPLFTAAISWVVLGETITYHFFGALALVTAGLWLFYQDERESKKPTYS